MKRNCYEFIEAVISEEDENKGTEIGITKHTKSYEMTKRHKFPYSFKYKL